MKKVEIIFGILEVFGAGLVYKYLGNPYIFGWLCFLGGYHLEKGLYMEEE